MSASVRVDGRALADARVEFFGALAGYNRYEALGRLTHLWSTCTELGRYALPSRLVDSILGPKGSQYLIEAELGEAFDGLVRVKGTKTRIEWLSTKRGTAVVGGEIRASTAKRGPDGRMLAENQIAQEMRFNPANASEPATAGQIAGPAVQPKPSAPIPALVLEALDTYSELHTDAECVELEKTSSSPPPTSLVPTSPVVATMQLANGDEFPLTESDVAQWSESFPAVDVMQALRAMRAWCLAKPNRRKTKRGVKAFIVHWLSRDQDRGGVRARAGPEQLTRKGQEIQAALAAGDPNMFAEFSRARR